MTSHDDSTKKRQRLLDNDRQKYQQAAQSQMSKQQDSISALKKENEKLKQDLAATTGGAYDFQEQDRLAAMQSEVEMLERKLQYERMRKNDIVKKNTSARIDVLQARKSMGGVNVTTENTQAVDKQVHVLENRLDQALVKFNEALAFNKSLREQIDNLREERKVFQRIYKKLESELHEKKKSMAEKIERANQDYEERDTLQQQLEALRQAAKEDQKKYEENFASIEAAMQQFKHVRDQQLQSMKSTITNPAATRGERGYHESPPPSSPLNSKKGTAASGHNPNESRHSNNDENAPHDDDETDLQDVVDQLKEATGIQDLDVLYHKFLKAEEHNFSMYNFVNELNTEQEQLESEIGQLKQQLAGEKGDAQRRKMLKELENELAQTEQQTERLASDTQRQRENLSIIRGVTQELFNRIGCSQEAARDLCGGTECNEMNLAIFLGLVEQRSTDILVAYNNAAQNEQRRRLQSRDEESRKRKERRQAERQARMEAGETVPEDDGDDEEETAANDLGMSMDNPESSPSKTSKFIGVGPSVAHNTVSATTLVRQHGLPNTNAGDAQADANDDVDEDNILSHEVLRQQMEQRLQQKREKDERGGRSKKRGGGGGGGGGAGKGK
jgi:hypothetical protein